MRVALRTLVLMSLALSLSAPTAHAGLVTVTLPEFSGPAALSGTYAVGSFAFSLPPGEQIIAAMISGTFGNSLSPSSSGVNVFLDGIQVASCVPNTACTQTPGPDSWSFVFDPSLFGIFSDGLAALSAIQTGGVHVRLGSLTLQLTTDALPSQVPEPATLLLTSLGAGLAAWRSARRKRRARPSFLR
jgi:hypothetical protein